MAKSLASEFNIVEALGQVAKEKNLGGELVLSTLRASLVGAARKYLGVQKNVEADIDQTKGLIRCFLRVEVVDDLPDYPDDLTPEDQLLFDEKYMLVNEAKQYQQSIRIGDKLEVEIPIAAFGRAAIQVAKQSLTQKVREVERQRVFDDYRDRIGTIVTGSVQQVDRGDILVNLGRTEAVVPSREQIRKERYRQGDSIRAYICDVAQNSKGPQVVLSRTHPEFLAKLFELEVPEIYDEIVEIRAVARDPGFRAKIAVFSRDERIDPVGACVGMKGNRVQAIVRELSNERVDIIHWTDDLAAYVKRLFSPADVKKVIACEDNRVVVVVATEDLSLAIGRSGQNVRLSSKLLGKEIDVYGEEDFGALTEEQRTDISKPAGR
jgi:N utilization substance protein A